MAAATDVLAISLASIGGAISYEFLFRQLVPLEAALQVGALAAAFFVLLCRSRRLYQLQAVLAPSQYFRLLFFLLAAALLGATTSLFLLKVGANYSRGAVIGFAAHAFILVPAGRFLAGWAAELSIERGIVGGRRVVTIGEGGELDALDARALFQFGIEEVTRIILVPSDTPSGREKRAHEIALAVQLARQLEAVEFVLVVPWQDKLINQLAELLRISPLPVKLLPDRTIRSIVTRQRQGLVTPYHLVEINRPPLTRWERIGKRAFDLSLSIAAIAVLLPFYLAIALAIRLDSAGPILFRQRRRGFDNREFTILKFRTMTVLENGDKIIQATRRDPRTTRLGRWLRRTSVDELPQLINVIRGDMSLVGPRPHAVAHDDAYRNQIFSYAMRHHVKPGITGAAQVHGLRGETQQISQMESRVREDLWYIDNWSFVLDLKILAATCRALFRHEAY
jgi:undecaprenyl-phosphate galactose phosphotransferase/putative colanic acid biosynthesis UDP-glucose lipid carrier transferase